MNRQQTTEWTFHAMNLEDLQGRLEYAFDHVVSYMPYLVPTFGGEIPNEDGVSAQYKLNEQGQLEFQGNNYIFGYTGNCQFGVVSWDEDRLLVFDEVEHDFHIVIRSEFVWFGGSNNTFKAEVEQ